MRRRYRIRPSKGVLVFSVIVGAGFTCVGVFFLIPVTWRFGPMVLFGLLWTAVAVYSTVSNLLVLLGKKNVTGAGGMEVYEEEDGPPPAHTAEDRLQELRSLYDRSLITQEEYEAKRQEILKEL